MVKSDFFLKVSRDIEKPPIVVWEKDGWDRGGRVFNSWHYMNFDEEKNPIPKEASGESLCKKRIKYPWISPEKLFFTDQILRLPTARENQISAYEDNIDDKFTKYIPPLKKEILHYLSPQDLKGSLNMEDVQGGVKVTLTLPLINGSSLNIFKTYNHEKIQELGGVEFRPCESWPNFRGDEWDRYYCMYVEIENGKLEPWVYNLTQNKPSKDYGRVLWELPKPPEAVSCNYNGQEAGVILLKSLERIRSLDISWDVVIDLGTTNTSVFYKEGNEVRPMEFGDRCVKIIDLAEETRKQTLNKLFFSPINYLGGIFPTSFIRLTPRSGVLNPVTDGQVPLGPVKDWFSLTQKDPEIIDLLKDGLKWSQDLDERNCLYAYLKYLILRIVAEAAERGVTKINLKWSYPSAFSEEMKNSLSDAFMDLPKWLKSKISINVEPEGETESVAICRYLSKPVDDQPGFILPTRVVVDIGGGTSDVGVWKENRIVFQTSILLAGQVLIDYLKSNENLRKSIISDLQIPDGDGALNNYFTNKCAHFFNNLINQHDLYSLFKITKSTAQGYQQARSIVFLVFAGIIYHTGLILKDIGITSCSIWLAGNGSRLINLVSDQRRAFTILKKFLPNEIELTRDINPPDPNETKQEVAVGLLVGPAFSTKLDPKIMVSEDGYMFDGKEVSFNQEITLDNFIHKIEAPRSYSQLEKFLKIYEECAKDLGLSSLKINHKRIQELMQGLINGLQNDIKTHKKMDKPYRGLIQPFFIEELNIIIKETLYKK